MKVGLKFCLVLLGAVLVLAIGYRTLFANISNLLAAEQPTLSYNLVPSGITFQIGSWRETVYYLPQFKMNFQDKLCTISGKAGSLTIGLPPKLQLKWKKKLDFGRKSITGGE